jgi:hypothetical protein
MKKGLLVFCALFLMIPSVFAANSGKITSINFLGANCGDKFPEHSNKVQISIEGGITDGSGNTRADQWAAVWAEDKHLVAVLMLAYQNDWPVTLELHPTQTYIGRPRIIAVMPNK